jgi:hypothetical protein
MHVNCDDYVNGITSTLMLKINHLHNIKSHTLHAMAHIMGVQKEIPKIELELGSMHLCNSFCSRRLAPFQDILANMLAPRGIQCVHST